MYFITFFNLGILYMMIMVNLKEDIYERLYGCLDNEYNENECGKETKCVIRNSI